MRNKFDTSKTSFWGNTYFLDYSFTQQISKLLPPSTLLTWSWDCRHCIMVDIVHKWSCHLKFWRYTQNAYSCMENHRCLLSVARCLQGFRQVLQWKQVENTLPRYFEINLPKSIILYVYVSHDSCHCFSWSFEKSFYMSLHWSQHNYWKFCPSIDMKIISDKRAREWLT